MSAIIFVSYKAKLQNRLMNFFNSVKKAYNGLPMESRTVGKQRKSFREGQEQTCDETRIGQPRDAKTEQNIEEVKDIRNIERGTTDHYIVLELDFGQSARYIIVTEDLNKHNVCEQQVVSHLLTDEQKALGDEVRSLC